MQGKSAAIAAKATELDLAECQKMRERWELAQRDFPELKRVAPEDYKDYMLVFRITEVPCVALALLKLKRADNCQ